MKNKTITSLYILAFIGGFFVLYFNGPKLQKVPIASRDNQPITTTKKNWETKTEEQASVTVVVTPLDLSPNSKEWKFDVGMNTHSVELDQDMTKIAVLVDDQEKEYNPIKWDGQTGGHHREGVLSFTPISPYPKRLTLKIKNIGGVERNFFWILNQ